MGTCERINCGYYWKGEWEDYPSCKFHGFGPAPCEVDDEYGEDEEEEIEDKYTLADLGWDWW